MNVRLALRRLLALEQLGLIAINLLIIIALALLAGSHVDKLTGLRINSFLNAHTLLQVATDTAFFAIMAVGATAVIIAGGIDLSVGSIYALSAIAMASVLEASGTNSGTAAAGIGAAMALGTGLLCGMANGIMVSWLRVHPFIITLGTMWIYRGIAFIMSEARSIPVPASLSALIKSPLGLSASLYPVPLLVMLAVTMLGAVFLSRTIWGRYIYAVGGNREASRYAGVPVERTTALVYAVSGLAAGTAAFIGTGYYGSAACIDASGYELYVVAAAVVGGASLSGGKGSAVSATLGALLIILFRQAIRTLRLDANYEWIVIGAAIIIAVLIDRIRSDYTGRSHA